MGTVAGSSIHNVIGKHQQDILSEWIRLLKEAGATGGGRIKEAELQTQCQGFLAALREATGPGDGSNLQGASFAPLRDLLGEMSRSRAAQGFSPTETATFVFSLKQPLFDLLKQENGELSTPVVKLWDGVLALPLIGTLDSARTQVVMENLLQSIVDENAEIAIIDIT